MMCISPEIVILAATRIEAAPIVASLSRPAQLPEYVARVWTGLLNKIPAVVACTGIGMHKTSAVLAEIRELAAGSIVLNIGIAGALADCIHPGDWREITGVTYEGTDKQYYASSVTSIVPSVRLLSVDSPITDRSHAESLYRRYAAEVVDMEGFAVAEFCESHAMAWHMLKMITDYADRNAPADCSAQLAVYSASCVELTHLLVSKLIQR